MKSRKHSYLLISLSLTIAGSGHTKRPIHVCYTAFLYVDFKVHNGGQTTK